MSPLRRSLRVKLGVGLGAAGAAAVLSVARLASALKLYSCIVVKGRREEDIPPSSPSKLDGMLTGLLVTLLGGHAIPLVTRLRDGGGGLSC